MTNHVGGNSLTWLEFERIFYRSETKNMVQLWVLSVIVIIAVHFCIPENKIEFGIVSIFFPLFFNLIMVVDNREKLAKMQSNKEIILQLLNNLILNQKISSDDDEIIVNFAKNLDF